MWTVIVPYRNAPEELVRLLESLPPRWSVIVVDDCSTERIPDCVSQRRRTSVLRLAERAYFAGAVNAGIMACVGDVLVLNQDVVITDADALSAAVREWQHVGAAIAGSAVMGHPSWPAGYVQGVCMYMSRRAIDHIGLLNQEEYPLWGCTAEWQLRACRAGCTALPVADVPGLAHSRTGPYGKAITQALQDEPQRKAEFLRTPPAVSVIVPCYNYGRYLPDALASLLGGESSLGYCRPQTFSDFEVIVVDDCSTDDSRSVIASLVSEQCGVRAVYLDENVGTAGAINAGIRASHGRYVTVLSADDMMASRRLGTLYRVAQQHPHSIIYDDVQIFRNGQLAEVWRMPGYDYDTLVERNQMHAGIFYSRQAWEDVGGYPEVMRDGREDWAFNVGAGLLGWCGVHVREPLYWYRREEQNRSLTNTTLEHHATFRARIQALYPAAYQIEGRTEMCCGKRASVASVRRASAAVAVDDERVLLRYLGSRPTTRYFTRTSPSTSYAYGGRIRTISVLPQHVDELLALTTRDGQPMFEIVKEAANG